MNVSTSLLSQDVRTDNVYDHVCFHTEIICINSLLQHGKIQAAMQVLTVCTFALSVLVALIKANASKGRIIG